ncbi:MFS transporter [Conyzicola nivalis]|uniref:MFS transporter n=1 Tax=Conyzicola nivalis TaxID=1477021 RepID=A0A916SAS1_9MICO|nr:MFS transporter [Conyzicola nivalis]
MTGRTKRQDNGALALLAFAQLVIGLDFGIVFTALPSIGAALSFSPENLQWVVSAYTLTIGGFILLGSRASDLLGRRRMFILGLILYAVASLIGGLAPTGGVLVAARAIQGLGGALLFPATLSLVNTTFAEGAARNRAIGVWSSAGAAGGAVGVVAGGLVTSLLGWEWVFFINVPLAAGAAVLAPVLLNRDAPVVSTAADLWKRFDVGGALAATVTALLLVFGLIRALDGDWGSLANVVTFAGSALAALIFIAVEKRVANPMLPFALFRQRGLITGVVVAFAFMAMFGAQFYLLNIWMQQVRHFDPAQAGLGTLPLSLCIVVGAQVGGRLVTRVGARTTLLIGIATGLVGLVYLSLSLSTGGNYFAELLPGVIVTGIGQGMTFTGLWITASTGASKENAGIVSGIASTAQQIGAPVGLAALVGIAHLGQPANASEVIVGRLNEGVSHGLMFSAVLSLLIGIVVLLVAPRRSRPAVGTTPVAMAVAHDGDGPVPV